MVLCIIMAAPVAFGIVGSRRRNTLHDRRIVLNLVELLVSKFGDGLVIVSGGCPKGADAFAEEAAKLLSVKTDITPVDKEGITSKWDFTKRAFARNRIVAERSKQGLFCLVADDRKGGTENTICHALELKIPVFLINNSGEVFLSQDGSFPKCEPAVRLLDLKSID